MSFCFTASEEPHRLKDIYQEAPGVDVLSPSRARAMRFDAYLASDFMWQPLPRGTCRIQMFHGVGGKYGFDAPTESLRPWHRLFFVNRRRLRNCIAAGAIDVLVATTVVEVGVDVPNATAMVVMDAERFGVSQLHQLRGRVGRGTVAGLCLLVTEAPPGSRSRERLEAVATTLDGFKLSRLDLEQRREGNVLGAAQAGRRSSLRLLTLLRDEDLIGRARAEATALVDADPGLDRHPALAAAISGLLGPDQAECLEMA